MSGKPKSYSFEDPAAVEGTPEQKLGKFRQVRDQIEQRIKTWLAELATEEQVSQTH